MTPPEALKLISENVPLPARSLRRLPQRQLGITPPRRESPDPGIRSGLASAPIEETQPIAL